jgi:hypothetical protein
MLRDLHFLKKSTIFCNCILNQLRNRQKNKANGGQIMALIIDKN